ncbi:MAG: Crp/Fnr family transcriptional regulator [Sphingomicrobium sp.]|nr:Crp/Fnr family transcriptional regulator [Sphingomonadales bacterium]
MSGLDHNDLHLILPHLSRVSVGHGEILFDANDGIDWIYFPETAIIALVEHDDNGRSIETGLVGREGFVGWTAVMGYPLATCRAIVQLDGGTLLRVGTRTLATACHVSQTLLHTLLQFVEAMTVQMSCSMLANATYPLSSRLARWLLMRHDRMPVDEIHVHHDEISASLGVRRASITDCLHLLEGERLIRSRRGKIVIVDRAGLIARAGGSYGVAEEHQRAAIRSANDQAQKLEPTVTATDLRHRRMVTAETPPVGRNC